MKIALITGSAGLIGSESVGFFCKRGLKTIGLDNNMRQTFFGEEASTKWNRVGPQHSPPTAIAPNRCIRVYNRVNTVVRNPSVSICVCL